MQANLFLVFWRRKYSFVLFVFVIFMFFWTWTFFNATNSHEFSYKNEFSNIDNPAKHAYLLQKLISQANRILRTQRDQNSKAAQSIPGILHTNLTNSKETTVATKTLSLLVRNKKAPLLVGEGYLFEEERLRILEKQQQLRQAGMEETINNNINMDEEMLPISSAERQIQYQHELQRMGVPIVADLGPDAPVVPHERLVHLDLKGAPPKLSFLKSLLPTLKILGATGLLIEYEDMFPFSNELAVLSARNAYDAAELKDFLLAVRAHDLSVMPLLQTFGHMEYVLKLQEFSQLREIPDSAQSICPSRRETLPLLQQMLTQIIEFHAEVLLQDVNNASASKYFTHIHIGCDEVYRMAVCDMCRQRASKEIFLEHVISLASFVRARWPALHVIIWDDMLRNISLSMLQNSNIGNYVEPMVWVYVNDIYRFISPNMWHIYAKVFTTAWAASAFKGAFGPTLLIPPLQRHLENNMRWLAVIDKEGRRFAKGFRGLALTGWQRYDHFAILCELLPVAMPSLITALSTVSRGYFSTNIKDNAMLQILQCSRTLLHAAANSRHSTHAWLELQPNSHHNQLFASCSYPGSLAYHYALRLYDKIAEVQQYLQKVQQQSGWMTDYNVRHNFSSTLNVHDLTRSTPMIIDELSAMARSAFEIFYEFFDKHTIAEFVEQQIYPTIQALQKHLANAQHLLQRQHWPQRPLPPAQELIDLQLIPRDDATAANKV